MRHRPARTEQGRGIGCSAAALPATHGATGRHAARQGIKARPEHTGVRCSSPVQQPCASHLLKVPGEGHCGAPSVNNVLNLSRASRREEGGMRMRESAAGVACTGVSRGAGCGATAGAWSTGCAANGGIDDAVWCRSRGLGKAMECDPLVSEHARVEPRSVRG